MGGGWAMGNALRRFGFLGDLYLQYPTQLLSGPEDAYSLCITAP